MTDAVVDIHNWRVAKFMIEWHGQQAEGEAMAALYMRMTLGDSIGIEEWVRTLSAIRQLQRTGK